MENIVGVIPARGGSKRILHKNIILLSQKPLISYTIQAAIKSKHINKVLVSTDDSEIADISKKLSVELIFPRPAELATDSASSVDVLLHAIRTLESNGQHVDTVILLQPTSPFRTHQHIDAAIDVFYNSNADTLTSVHIAKDHPYWLWKMNNEEILPLYTPEHIAMGRDKLPQYFIENGAIYIIKRSVLFKDGLYGQRVVPFVMNDFDSIDIDEPLDLAWAEFLLSRYISLSKGENEH
jgi:CMP-N,N'-diacetyllegionaminic acid synthase